MFYDDKNVVVINPETPENISKNEGQQLIPPEKPMPLKVQRIKEIFSLEVKEDTEENNE